MISLSADARIEFGAVLRLKASSRIQEILQRLGRLSQHPRPRPLTRISGPHSDGMVCGISGNLQR